MREIAGQLSASKMNAVFVVSRFNSFFTEQLLKGAVDCFVRHGGRDEDVTVIRVPGANELPLIAQQVAVSKKYDMVVVLGAVIQGATPHADLINGTVARALAKISLKTGVPVLNGVVCADNLEQAIERSGTKAGNKGWDVTQSAIEMVSLCKQVK